MEWMMRVLMLFPAAMAERNTLSPKGVVCMSGEEGAELSGVASSESFMFSVPESQLSPLVHVRARYSCCMECVREWGW